MPIRKSLADLNCSLAQALDIVGDGWTLLILRDLYLGARRFSELAQSLEIARNILSERLERLVAEGLVLREGTATRPCYQLADKGWELVPALVGLMQWGDRHYAPNGPPLRILDADGAPVGALALHSREGGAITPKSTHAAPGRGAEPRTRAYVTAVGARRRQER